MVAVATLGIVVLAGASGFVGRAVGGLGGSLSAALGRLTAASSASPTAGAALGAPVLLAPNEPYTNQLTVDVSGTIPAQFAGQAGIRIRLYRAVGSTAPAQVDEQAVGGSVSFTFPAIALAAGTNTFTATIADGTSESPPSAAVSFVLDTKAPPLTITSPRNGATVNRAAATITGRTQPRSVVVVHNTDSSANATGTAGADGTFSVAITLVTGSNTVTVTATDPAGNAKSATLTIRRGSGALKASISASRYQFSAKGLPDPLSVFVLVLDPDGKPLGGATVTFTISIPGVPIVTAGGTTDATGRASFSTTVPKGAMPGTGPAAVLVHTTDFGDTTDRTVITITK